MCTLESGRVQASPAPRCLLHPAPALPPASAASPPTAATSARAPAERAATWQRSTVCSRGSRMPRLLLSTLTLLALPTGSSREQRSPSQMPLHRALQGSPSSLWMPMQPYPPAPSRSPLAPAVILARLTLSPRCCINPQASCRSQPRHHSSPRPSCACRAACRSPPKPLASHRALRPSAAWARAAQPAAAPTAGEGSTPAPPCRAGSSLPAAVTPQRGPGSAGWACRP